MAAVCPLCTLTTALCVCDALPRVETATRVIVVAPLRELRKSTNTGALAVRCLARGELHVSGARDQVVDYGALTHADATNLLLFPEAGAVPLEASLVRTFTAPVRLIVPDGHWGQAARIRGKLRDARDLVVVSLPPGPSARHPLRREARDRPEGVATIEAIARALEILEGPHASRPLLDVYALFIARALRHRGRAPRTASSP